MCARHEASCWDRRRPPPPRLPHIVVCFYCTCALGPLRGLTSSGARRWAWHRRPWPGRAGRAAPLPGTRGGRGPAGGADGGRPVGGRRRWPVRGRGACVRTPVDCGQACAPIVVGTRVRPVRSSAARLCAAERGRRVVWWDRPECVASGLQPDAFQPIWCTQRESRHLYVFWMLHAAAPQPTSPKRHGFRTNPGAHLLAVDAVHAHQPQPGARPQHLPHQLEWAPCTSSTDAGHAPSGMRASSETSAAAASPCGKRIVRTQGKRSATSGEAAAERPRPPALWAKTILVQASSSFLCRRRHANGRCAPPASGSSCAAAMTRHRAASGSFSCGIGSLCACLDFWQFI